MIERERRVSRSFFNEIKSSKTQLRPRAAQPVNSLTSDAKTLLEIIGIKDLVSVDVVFTEEGRKGTCATMREKTIPELSARKEREVRRKKAREEEEEEEKEVIAKSHCAKLAVELCCDFLKSRKRRPAEKVMHPRLTGRPFRASSSPPPSLSAPELTSRAFFHACLHDDV